MALVDLGAGAVSADWRETCLTGGIDLWRRPNPLGYADVRVNSGRRVAFTSTHCKNP